MVGMQLFGCAGAGRLGSVGLKASNHAAKPDKCHGTCRTLKSSLLQSFPSMSKAAVISIQALQRAEIILDLYIVVICTFGASS